MRARGAAALRTAPAWDAFRAMSDTSARCSLSVRRRSSPASGRPRAPSSPSCCSAPISGIGALAHDLGFSVAGLMLSTLLVWAAPGAGHPDLGARRRRAAGSRPRSPSTLSGVRLLPMVVALLPMLRTRRRRARSLLCRRTSPRSACGSKRCGFCRAARARSASHSATGSAPR